MRNLVVTALLSLSPAFAFAQAAPIAPPPMPYQPPLMHYVVKVLHDGKVETEFTMDMRSDRPGVMANQRTHGYILGCTQTLNANKSTDTGLLPGTATEGLTVQGSVDPDTGNHAVFDVTISSLRSMRRIKQGDCEIEVPDISTIHQTIAVDVPIGETVSTQLAGTSYGLTVTHLTAL